MHLLLLIAWSYKITIYFTILVNYFGKLTWTFTQKEKCSSTSSSPQPLTHLQYFFLSERVPFLIVTRSHFLNICLGENDFHSSSPGYLQPPGTHHTFNKSAEPQALSCLVHVQWGTECETLGSHSQLPYLNSLKWGRLIWAAKYLVLKRQQLQYLSFFLQPEFLFKY